MTTKRTSSTHLGYILRGLRLTLAVALGAVLMAVGSVWTVGAMASTRR